MNTNNMQARGRSMQEVPFEVLYNFSSLQETAAVLKTLIDTVNVKLIALEKRMDSFDGKSHGGVSVDEMYLLSNSVSNISNNLQNLGRELAARFSADVNSTAGGLGASIGALVQSMEQIVGDVQTLERSMQGIETMVQGMQAKMNEPVAPTLSPESVIELAVKESYNVISPLIPTKESPESLRQKLEQTFVAEKLDAKNLKNLEDNIDGSKIKNLPARQVIVEQVPGGFIETPIKNSSGAVLSKDASGAYVLPATSGGGLTELPTASTIDDSNITFVFASHPTYLVINGSWRKINEGWSGAGTTITLIAPVGVGGSIYGIA